MYHEKYINEDIILDPDCSVHGIHSYCRKQMSGRVEEEDDG